MSRQDSNNRSAIQDVKVGLYMFLAGCNLGYANTIPMNSSMAVTIRRSHTGAAVLFAGMSLFSREERNNITRESIIMAGAFAAGAAAGHVLGLVTAYQTQETSATETPSLR